MTRKTASILLVASLLATGTALAAEKNGKTAAINDAAIAIKSAQVENLRSRLSTVLSPTASATLIEAENLLRQLQAAPPAKRSPIAAQLDAALTRGDLEVDAAARGQQ